MPEQVRSWPHGIKYGMNQRNEPARRGQRLNHGIHSALPATPSPSSKQVAQREGRGRYQAARRWREESKEERSGPGRGTKAADTSRRAAAAIAAAAAASASSPPPRTGGLRMDIRKADRMQCGADASATRPSRPKPSTSSTTCHARANESERGGGGRGRESE